MDTTTPQPASNAAPEKKPLFETVITSTPVLLMVIATFILGQSTSEMTKAQYQRAVASQKQSKVGDQWGFFQAKRIRGSSYEMTADLLLAQKADPFARDTLEDAAQSLIQDIEAGEKLVRKQSGAKSPDQLKALAKKAEQAAGQIKTALNPPAEGWQGKKMLLKPDNVKAALDALEAYPEAKAEKSPEADPEIAADQVELLNAILDDIRKFKPEKEIAPKTLPLKEAALDQAMERAKAAAGEVNARGKAIDRVLEEFDVLVAGQVALAREFQRTMASYISAARKAGESAETGEARDLVDHVRGTTAKLQGDYKAARHAFTARRYEDDARSNQDAAYLYDVQVLQSSARSDRHLKRSFGFLIAMLVAQVGVTIGTLAISFKRRVPVWAVAALSGLVAIAFGVYIFLELGPLL